MKKPVLILLAVLCAGSLAILLQQRPASDGIPVTGHNVAGAARNPSIKIVSSPARNHGSSAQERESHRVLELLSRLTQVEPIAQDRQLADFADSLSQNDFQTTLALLAKTNMTPLEMELSQRLIHRWAGMAPAEAARWLTNFPPVPHRATLAGVLGASWAETDFAAASSWAEGLSRAEDRQAAIISIGYEAGSDHPLEALRMAATLEPGDARDDLLAHTVSNWAESAPGTAAEWALKVEDTTLRDRLTQLAVATWSEQSPREAAAWLLDATTPGEAQNAAVATLIQRWAQSAPADAASWVVQFPAGPLQDQAISEIVKLWTPQDSQAVQSWLGTLENAELQDAAVRAFVRQQRTAAPELARAWAARIKDDAMRTRELNAINPQPN